MSSNFPRAVETAQILAPALGSMPIGIDAGWGEHDPGPDLDGISWDNYVAKFGTPTWSDPDEVMFPGGETVGQFHTRVVRTLRETVRRHEGETIVVACHGGVVDADILCRCIKLENSNYTLSILHLLRLFMSKEVSGGLFVTTTPRT
jgi:probable phosphoglycerate mutase